MDIKDLLNCPFCNGGADYAIYTVNKTSNGVAVRCPQCGAETMRFTFVHTERPAIDFIKVLKRMNKCKAQAAEMWNKRYKITEP